MAAPADNEFDGLRGQRSASVGLTRRSKPKRLQLSVWPDPVATLPANIVDRSQDNADGPSGLANGQTIGIDAIRMR
jgi:hypothetical protein